MTVEAYIAGLRKRLETEYSVNEARAMAFRVVCDVMGWDLSKVYSSGEREMSELQVERLDSMSDDLCSGRPLQYVLGHTEFAGLNIKVKEGCLIPRPETEMLFSLAADDAEKMMERNISSGQEGLFNVLDICTGSGCIAYAFASCFSGIQIYGCDISEDALSIACKQRVRQCGAKPVFFHADVMTDPPPGLPKFDMIISNPPYVLEKERVDMSRNVLDYEPEIALFVPDDDPLVFYKSIKRWTEMLLKPSGHVWMEVNEKYAGDVACLFPGSLIVRDFNEKDRFVYAGK